MSRSKASRELDRLSASRMFLPQHVSLSNLPDSITLRFKLRRMGIKEDSAEYQALVNMIDSLGFQLMLKQESITSRFASVQRDIIKKKIFK